MIKLIRIIIAFTILPVFFFSCEDSDYDDNEAPQIDMIHIDDTLYLGISSSKFNRIEIGFTDNKALSSYNIHLKPDTNYFGTDNAPVIIPNGKDSMAYEGIVKSALKVDIFGKDTISISTSLYSISSTFSKFDYVQNKTVSYAVRAGKYLLSVECLDIAGNAARKDVKSVYVLYPDSTIIKDK